MIVRLFGVFIGCMTKPILFHTDLPVYQKFLQSFSLRKKKIVIIPAILNLAQEQPQWRNLIQMSSFLGEGRSYIKNETLRDFVGKRNLRKTTSYPYNTLIIRLAPIKVKKTWLFSCTPRTCSWFFSYVTALMDTSLCLLIHLVKNRSFGYNYKLKSSPVKQCRRLSSSLLWKIVINRRLLSQDDEASVQVT